jgi:hypothetical protein
MDPTQGREGDRLVAHRAGLGRFDPIGLHLSLDWQDSEEQSYEAKISAMATLMHERCHWLQLIGTSAGRFSSWLSTLQAGLLRGDDWDSKPLSAADLPLVESERVDPVARRLWIACERVHSAVFGGEAGYIEFLASVEGSFQAEVLDLQLSRLGSLLLDEDPDYEAFQEGLRQNPIERGTAILLDQDGVALGATHLMEATARLHELFRLSDGIRATHPDMEVFADGYFFPPYSYARDLYFEIQTDHEPGVRDEMAICVLADWALNPMIMPAMPLTATLGESPALLPGPLFAALVRLLDLDALPPLDETTRVTYAEGFVAAIYAQIKAKEPEIVTPVEMAKVHLALMGSLLDLKVPKDVYDFDGDHGGIKPRDASARLRYTEYLACRASQTRIENPAFFALPYAFYSVDRKLFHGLWDPIEPPILSIGELRLVPTVEDSGWFTFFCVNAIQHDLGMFAPTGDCTTVGRRLQAYRRSRLAPEEEDHLITDSVKALFGDGEASAAIIAASRA